MIVIIDELALNSNNAGLNPKEYKHSKDQLIRGCVLGKCKLILIGRDKPRTDIPYGLQDFFVLYQYTEEDLKVYGTVEGASSKFK